MTRIITLEFEKHAPQAISLFARAFGRRFGTLDDFDAVFPHSYGGKLTKTFGAVAGETLQGLIVLHQTEPGKTTLDWLAVDPGARRQGIGGRLLKHAGDFIAGNWVPEGTPEGTIYFCDISRRADISAGYYEKRGYTLTSTVTEEEPCKTRDRLACRLHDAHHVIGDETMGTYDVRGFEKKIKALRR